MTLFLVAIISFSGVLSYFSSGTSRHSAYASPVPGIHSPPRAIDDNEPSWRNIAASTGTTGQTRFRNARPSNDPLSALVRRLLPAQYHDHFLFTLNPDLVPASKTNIHDTFRVSNENSRAKIVIEGASLAGLGAGLNYYLRKVCQVEISWSGDRFNDMPAVPPAIVESEGVMRASFVPWRYYANVVTFGYSFAFWDWSRWEREIDWMFLNGVNMALAMVGQEYVFREMYESLGVSREELNQFFAGPAFTPWQRMGNIQGSWGFPNDNQFKHDWIDSQWELQLKIMRRMQDFNITAILPSFNGFVPNQLASKFPEVKFQKASQWRLPDPYTRVTFVPSTESFFVKMTHQFIQLQNSMYQKNGINFVNTDKHHYLLDLFNELLPVCMTVQCLKQITGGVMRALKDADPKAFLLRGPWYEERTRAFFDGIREVNNGRDAFVIDLQSEVNPLWRQTRGYFGMDWGWSMLNNFGARQMLYGSLPMLLTEPFKAYQEPSKTLRGIGITMEGINNNEYLYQVVLDIPWESIEANVHSVIATDNATPMPSGQRLDQQPLDAQAHLEAFFKRRYGPDQTSDAVLEAWTILSKTVWNIRGAQMSQTRSVLDFTPALNMDRIGFMSTMFWYRQSSVVSAWSQIVQSTETDTSKKRRRDFSDRNSIEVTFVNVEGDVDFEDKGQMPLSEVSSRTWRGTKILSTRISSSTQFKLQNLVVTPSIFCNSAPTPVKESDLPLNVSSFRYDLVDVTREIMVAIVIPGIHKELVGAYKSKNLKQTRFWGNTILQAISDTDRILNTHSHFMLGPWIRDARVSAKVVNPSSNSLTNMSTYADYLEHHARNQITWWAPVGQGVLANYASKEWGGLVKNFYYPRWKIFVNHLMKAVQDNVELDTKAYLADSLQMEAKWLKDKTCLGHGCSPLESAGVNGGRKDYPLEAVDDTAIVAQDLRDKWHNLAERFAKKADLEREGCDFGSTDNVVLRCVQKI
ncbi:hypothetical protein BGX26_001188 [Mortierella sp. AD094]|nr:hypothetical protein BGX26_001188 [Mortierella sp. AD094]